MPGKSDIKAGAAYVELGLKDAAFTRGLRKMQRRLQSWGKGIMTFGAGVTAAGAAVLGPIMKAITQFASVGDNLDKMSQRTGTSVQFLTEMGFAAEQSGASLESVEATLLKMNRRLGRATSIGGPAKAAMEALGLSFEQLKAMSPEERFEAIGEAINNYGDYAAAAGIAQKAFGTGIDKLIPLFKAGKDGIAAMRQEARDSGLVPSDEAVADAAKVTDAINRIKRVAGATIFEIGAALAPAVLPALDVVKRVMVAIQRWVKDNGALFVTLAKVGVILVAVGSLVTGLGLAVFTLGMILGGAATVLTTIGTLLGFLISPVGLLTAAVIGGVTAWLLWTDSGQKAVNTVQSTLAPFLKIAQQTFAGIREAIMAGDLSLAGSIAMAGLKLAFLTGMDQLANSVGGMLGDVIGTFSAQVAGGDFAGTWNTAILGMAAIWDTFTEGIVAGFTAAANAVVDVWQNTINAITDYLLGLSAQGGATGKIVSKVLGVDLSATQAKEERIRLDAINSTRKAISAEEELLSHARANGGRIFDDVLGEEVTEADIKARIVTLNEKLQSKGAQPRDILGDSRADARSITGRTADSLREQLAKMNRAARESTNESLDNLKEATKGGASGVSESVRKAQEELDELNRKAAEARAAEDARRAKEQDELAAGFEEDEQLASSRIFGAFSSAALLALGTGQANRPEERAARAAEKTADKAEAMEAHLEDISIDMKALKNLGFIE